MNEWEAITDDEARQFMAEAKATFDDALVTEAQREREAIVAWLRATANIFDPRDPTNLALSWAYLDASNAIERGEYLNSSATASHSDDTGMSGTGQPRDAVRGSEGK